MSSASKNSPGAKSAVSSKSAEQAVACNPFPIVGIGASAGGLEAFTQLLNHLPENTGMAFVLVQHLDPDHPSQLTSLLSRATAMPVREVKNGMAIEPNHIYVIPPNANINLSAGKLKLTPRGKSLVPHPVDYFFSSLAKEQLSWAIGIILSGTGSDGAIGLKEIKGAGGITFAQDEKSARFSGMPLQAAGDSVDFILPPEKIALELARIGLDPYLALPQKTETEAAEAATEKDFRRILTLLRSHTAVDFSQYRDTTIKRRIQRRMLVRTRRTLAEYIELLERDRAEISALFDDVLINVTSFFRDPEMFETLKARIFPEILKNDPHTIRVWVAGCSSGQEAYSLAIALLEFLEHKPNAPGIQIFATDISETISIEKGRRGLYPESIESEISPERLRRFFTKEDGSYRISKAIRDVCIFAKQNVTSDPPFSRMDLVSCRNLLIYLTPPLQRHVVSTFHYALNPNGFLVLGNSETVGANSDLFELLDRKQKIYSKKNAAIRPFPHFAAQDLKSKPIAIGHAAPVHPSTPADFQKEADRILLGRYAPAGVLVNSNLEVLQFRGRTSPYLEPPSGEASFNLLKMARENLSLELGTAIREAKKKNSVVRRNVRLRDSDTIRKVNLEILPVKLSGSAENCFLVLFEDADKERAAAPPARKEIADKKISATEKDRELKQLRTELTAAREYLQAITEQQDAANEELKCANEEVLSSNEELQSTNEQLGTAKEELQSTNEELQTLNEELQTRNTELNQLNNDLSNLLASVQIPILMLGNDLRVRRFNPAAVELLALKPAVIGRPLHSIDLPFAVRDLEKSLLEVIGKVTQKEIEVRDREGRWFSLRLHPYRTADNRIDGVIMALVDIEELKRAHEKALAHAIVESSSDAIIGNDLDGKIISCNHGAARLFGYKAEELIGQPVTMLIPPDRQEEEAEILARIRRGESIEHYETVRRRQDGSLLDVSLTISPVKDIHGKIIGASKIARDITENKRAEKNLTESLEREKKANRAKDDFLAALSHELRTPLNPVLLIASDAAADRELPPGVRANFETIRKNVELEARLIDDLLDLTRIVSGKLSFEIRAADAHAILQDALVAIRAEAEEKQIQLNLMLRAKRHQVRGDPARLQQVFWNILKNAVKFTPRGGKITVETFASEKDRHLSVKITDTGIGMMPEELKRIFMAFSQGDHAAGNSHRFGGLGLGLAISKKIIELHSGHIRAASDGRDQGSTFTIELPLTENKSLSQSKNADTGLHQNEKSKKTGARILLVEDHEPTRSALTRLLMDRHYKIATAGSIAEAREITAKEKFDFVISDIGLPDGSGNDLMLELRERHGLKGIALTGYGMEDDIKRNLAAGFVAHLTKPVHIQSLEKVLLTPALSSR
jgi:two-component system CheB/CheR fusion protein